MPSLSVMASLFYLRPLIRATVTTAARVVSSPKLLNTYSRKQNTYSEFRNIYS